MKLNNILIGGPINKEMGNLFGTYINEKWELYLGTEGVYLLRQEKISSYLAAARASVNHS